MHVVVETLPGPDIDMTSVEIVERKGLGHPDSVCDALAERLSRALSQFYRDQFGLVLHHNVDKVLLCGGAARPAFGGGTVDKPIEIHMAGRATDSWNGIPVPVHALAVDGTRQWLRENLRAVDAQRDVIVHCAIKPGSQELVELYQRAARTGVRLANDTSIGVGFAPLSRLETLVLETERHLTSRAFCRAHPAAGEDVKVMGVRRDERISLTVSCAMIARHVPDLAQYVVQKEAIADDIRAFAGRTLGCAVEVVVNAADDAAAGSVYLTVGGTSAEAGDDGEAGRGNRANGLITPYRPMTMESCAGKNPVTHVGKLYNVVAGLIAQQIVDDMPEVAAVECRLVSRIGYPIGDPEVVDVRIRPRAGDLGPSMRRAAERIARGRLAELDALCDALVAGDVAIDRWPLGLPRLERRWRAARARLLAEIEADARTVAGTTQRPVYAARVMAAMARVPRHAFVPAALQDSAYVNTPLPIGYDQTISQPFIVAVMTDLLDLDETSRVLEIGTGSGYQCAVLAEIAAEVFSIEFVAPLAQRAGDALQRLGYDNAHVRAGDGYHGWPEHAPFDAIIVTAGATSVPAPLLAQLKPGGKLVIPCGDRGFGQQLRVIEKRRDGSLRQNDVLAVAFVPFVRDDAAKSD